MPKTRASTGNAIDLLKEDHEKLKRAFKQFEKMDRADSEGCRELVERVCADLRVHTTLEEEIFYPAVREALRHHGVRRLIHGHTHRPGVQRLELDGRSCERWVLPDWYGRGGYLELANGRPRLVRW